MMDGTMMLFKIKLSLSICIFSSSHLVLRSTSCLIIHVLELLLDMYITGEVEFGAVRGSVAPVYKRLDQSPPLDDKFMWLLCPTITEPSKNLRKGCLLRLKQVFVESGFWVKSKLTNKANPQWTPKIYDDLFSIYPSWFKKLKLRGTIERGHILKDHKRQVLTYWRW